MTATTDAYEAILKKFSNLPVIHQAAKQHAAQVNAEATAARQADLAQLKTLREEEQKALAEVAALEALLPAARLKLTQLESRVTTAVYAARQVNSQWQNINRKLIEEHGEAAVMHAQYVLWQLCENAKKQIVILGESMNPAVFADGKFIDFRKVDPAANEHKLVWEGQLKKLEKLFIEAQSLTESPMGPAELKGKCEDLLVRAGYQPSSYEFIPQ